MKKAIMLDIIKNFQLHKQDSGSPSVVIALLTEQIRETEKFLQKHPDRDVRLKLIKFIHEKRRLMNYLSTTNVETYQKLEQKLKKHFGDYL